MDHLARIEALQDECERLRDRIAQLESALGQDIQMPMELCLTQAEATIVGLLHARGRATKQQIHDVLYALRPNDVPEIKIVDVLVCNIRKKIGPYGLLIETLWGSGYAMTTEVRAKLTGMIGGGMPT